MSTIALRQNLYAMTTSGEYARIVTGSVGCSLLSSTAQVAARYLETQMNRHFSEAARLADEDYVRAFLGTEQEFVATLFAKSLMGTALFFQDAEITDECTVWLNEFDSTTPHKNVLDALEANDCIEHFEDHLILFTSDDRGW